MGYIRNADILGGVLKRLSIAAMVLFPAVIVVLIVAAPQVTDKTDKIQEEWSRGLRVGHSPWNQPPAIATFAAPLRVHLAWVDSGPGGVGVRYMQLDASAAKQAEGWFGGLEGTPQSPQLLLDGQGRAHIFVMARLPGGEEYRLIHVSPQADGSPRVALHAVSPPGLSVNSYAVVPEAGGGWRVLWTADPESGARGVYTLRFDLDGQVLEDARRVNARPAVELSAQLDRENTLHAIWAETSAGPSKALWRRFYYAGFPGGKVQAVDGVPVGQADAPARLGLDNTHAYLFWGKQVSSGDLIGMAFTSYSYFRLDRPEPNGYEDLQIPMSGQPQYLPYEGAYAVRSLGRAAAPGSRYVTDFVYAPMPVAGQRDELAVATVAALSFGIDRQVVPTLVILRDGKPVGYQVIAYREGSSAQPVVAADASGNFHALWLSGSTGHGFDVFYAATVVPVLEQLDRTDLIDLWAGAVRMFWKVIGGIVLLPFLPMIVAPPLAILVAWAMFGPGTEGLLDRTSYVVLGAVCLVYWLMKELLLGPVVDESILAFGFSGYTQVAVIWAIQLGIAVASALVTGFFIRRKSINSILAASLIFMACDITLTMLAAGPSLALRG
jgi:hypothetical protein